MVYAKYNNRAGKLTQVIRQVKSRGGYLFHLRLNAEGVILVKLPETFGTTNFRRLDSIGFTELHNWLLAKTK